MRGKLLLATLVAVFGSGAVVTSVYYAHQASRNPATEARPAHIAAFKLLPPWSETAPLGTNRYPLYQPQDTRVIVAPAPGTDKGGVSQTIETKMGLVKVVRGCSDPTADYCSSLLVNGKPLLEDADINLALGYPDKLLPDMLIVNTATGGNACCWSTYLIDLSGTSPKIWNDLHITGKLRIWSDRGGLLFISGTDDSETDDNGDPIIVTYIYYLSKRTLVAAPYDRKTFFPQYKGRYSNQLLSDKVFRKPIAAIMKDNFKSFRELISSESPVTWVGNRFLIGEGQRYGQGGMYIFDTATGVASAYWYTSDRGMQHAGRLPTAPEALEVAEAWKRQISVQP